MMVVTPWQRWRWLVRIPIPRHIGHAGIFLSRVEVGVKVNFKIRFIHEILFFRVFLVFFIFWETLISNVSGSDQPQSRRIRLTFLIMHHIVHVTFSFHFHF